MNNLKLLLPELSDNQLKALERILLEIGCEPETIEVIIQDIFYTVLEEYKLLSKTRKANETNETT